MCYCIVTSRAHQLEDINAVKTLVALGADVNLQDISGEGGLTPLDLACLKAARSQSNDPDSSIKMSTLNIGQRITLFSDLEAVQKGFERTVEYSMSLPHGVKDHQGSKSSEIVSTLKSVGASPGQPSSSYKYGMHPTVTLPKHPHTTTRPSREVDHDSVKENTDTQPRHSSPCYFKDLEDSINVVKDPDYQLSPGEALEVVSKIQESERYRKVFGSRILCLDGGGVKGLVQIELLRQLEERTGKRVIDLFDWIVGTSTGGIIALTLVYGKHLLLS